MIPEIQFCKFHADQIHHSIGIATFAGLPTGSCRISKNTCRQKKVKDSTKNTIKRINADVSKIKLSQAFLEFYHYFLDSWEAPKKTYVFKKKPREKSTSSFFVLAKGTVAS